MQGSHETSLYDMAPWMRIAHGYIGTHELMPTGELNPIVRDFFHATRFPMEMVGRTTPWCGAFGCSCLSQAGVISPRSAKALDFLSYGVALKRPIFGCLCIFRRGVNAAKQDQAHVAFCNKVPAIWPTDTLEVCGGNQRNQVCLESKLTTDLLGLRWPSSWPVPPEALR